MKIIRKKKRKNLKKISLGTRLLCIALLIFMFSCLVAIGVNAENTSYTLSYNETQKLFLSQSVPTVATVQGEWQLMSISRGNYNSNKEYYEGYYKNVVDTVIETKGVLSTKKYTEFSRVILALTSIGKDVTDVQGYNLLEYLGDFKKVNYQGVNGTIWGLIALDSNSYEIPVNTTANEQTTRQLLVDEILKKELSTGGWALSGKTPDPDLTAMALVALEPYYSQSKVKTSVDRAVALLSSLQNSNGGYSSWGTENSESIAQVIICLTTLGINPYTDSRFIKNGNSLVDALLSYSVQGGGFSHEINGKYNQMASEQCYLALVALDRFVKGKNSVFNMSDVFESEDNSDKENITTETRLYNYITEKNVTTKASTTKPKESSLKSTTISTTEKLSSSTTATAETQVKENLKLNVNAKQVTTEPTVLTKTAEASTSIINSTIASATEENTTITASSTITSTLSNSENTVAEKSSHNIVNVILIVAIVCALVVLVILIIYYKKSKKL